MPKLNRKRKWPTIRLIRRTEEMIRQPEENLVKSLRLKEGRPLRRMKLLQRLEKAKEKKVRLRTQNVPLTEHTMTH